METTTKPPRSKAATKRNPYLATVGKYANEPLWDALQEEMQKRRDAADALVDTSPIPTAEKAV